jgi:hypothetical protein
MLNYEAYKYFWLVSNIFVTTEILYFFKSFRSGAVVHICNLSCLGGGDLEDQDLRPAWAKSQQEAILTIKAGCGDTRLLSQLWAEKNKYNYGQVGLGRNMRPYYKNN